MSYSLWYGDGPNDCIWLGDEYGICQAMDSISREVAFSPYDIPDSLVTTLPIWDNDFKADADYLAKLKEEAGAILDHLRDKLKPEAVDLLENIRHANTEPEVAFARFDAGEHIPRLHAAIEKHGYEGAASLEHLRGEMLDLARTEQDALFHHARNHGVVNLLPLNKDVATEKQKKAAVNVDGQDYGFMEKKGNDTSGP